MENEKNIDASEAVPVLAQAHVALEARVAALEASFSQIASALHQVTAEARERLSAKPQQKPTNLN